MTIFSLQSFFAGLFYLGRVQDVLHLIAPLLSRSNYARFEGAVRILVNIVASGSAI
jgi:hypothetical protein